jgi:5'-3' exonuclease
MGEGAMILVDFNQVMIGSLMMNAKRQSDVSEDLLRHMILNTLRMYRKQFNKNYGELVICNDSRHYWRKDVFPLYKAGRKAGREKSPFDWEIIFSIFDQLREDLKTHFPYKYIDVMGAEADDVIGVICKYHHAEEKICILSSDKDFIQLHKYKGVQQYSPMQKKFIRHPSPIAYLKEHTIRGDRGDGIPNFLSSDDCLVEGVRQSSISKKNLAVWLTQKPEEICTTAEMADRWKRNDELVNLEKIPQLLINDIQNAFAKEPLGSRKKLYDYFVMNKLSRLTDVITDF